MSLSFLKLDCSWPHRNHTKEMLIHSTTIQLLTKLSSTICISEYLTSSDKRAHSGNFSKPNRNFLTKNLIVKCSFNATYKQGILDKKLLTVAVADIIIDVIKINSIITQSIVPIETSFSTWQQYPLTFSDMKIFQTKVRKDY